MKRTSLRLASLAMALFTVLSLAHALAEEGYTPYPAPRLGYPRTAQYTCGIPLQRIPTVRYSSGIWKAKP